MDALSNILHSMRLANGLISLARLSEPWCIETSGYQGTIFHAVVSGHCWLQREGAKEVELSQGDIMLVTRGDSHRLFDRHNEMPVSIRSLTDPNKNQLAVIEYGGGGPQTVVMCGVFRLESAAQDILQDLLPPELVVRQRTHGVVAWLESTLRMMSDEIGNGLPGGDAVLARLTDVLLVHVLRAYAAGLPNDAHGWLAATRDPQIGQALALIHNNPTQRFTAASLASQVGMSRSGFFARFSSLVGEPPARYLTRWRMQKAADLLLRSDQSVAVLAESVGYSSEDAFCKAFKRVMHVSPAVWRRQKNPRLSA